MALVEPKDTMKPTTLVADRLSLGYGAHTIVEHADLVIPPGRVTALVGPNGCGKSTLLRGLAAILPARDGQVVLDGKDIRDYSAGSIARRLGLLPQGAHAPESMTVREICALGRYPHQNWLKLWTAHDEEAVTEAMKATHVNEFADRPMETLSGGQRQRAWIAMVLAQDTDVLLLDEPTTYLDMGHQLEVLDLVRDLNRLGKTVVMVLHDLNQASHYSDNLVVLQDGTIDSVGDPEEVLTAEMIRRVFCVQCRILRSEESGRPLCLPLARVMPGE